MDSKTWFALFTALTNVPSSFLINPPPFPPCLGVPVTWLKRSPFCQSSGSCTDVCYRTFTPDFLARGLRPNSRTYSICS